MLFFNANFICYYFYPTKKREEPKKGAVTKCVIILPQPFFYWNIPLEDYPTCVFIGSV